MKHERRKRWLRGRCNACRGFLKIRPLPNGQFGIKQVSCICKAIASYRFSRPTPGGKVRK